MLERVGTPLAFNINVLGALIGMRERVEKVSALKVVAEGFPPSFIESTTKALEIGF